MSTAAFDIIHQMAKNKITFILLLLIIIIAAFLRLYNINGLPPGLYPDEAMNGNNALEAISSPHLLKSILTFGNSGDGFKVFYPENNGREGLFINIQAVSVAIFGNQPWALRGVSAIFGILTVLGVYFLTKELFRKEDEQPKYFRGLKLSETIALLAAFFLATNFWHINFSRIGFRAITAPFWLTWGLYFLLLAFRKNSFKLMALAGFVFGMGIHSYIAYRATPVIIAIIFGYWYFQYKEKRKELMKSFGIFVLLAFIAALPLLYYFAIHPQDFMGRTSQVSIFSTPSPIKSLVSNTVKTALMFDFSGDANWRHNYSGRPELFWPVGIMFIAGIIMGLFYLFRKTKNPTILSNNTYPTSAQNNSFERFPFLVLFSWLVVAALPVVMSDEGIPHSLRSILMIPPAFILAGFGGIWIYEKTAAKISDIRIRETIITAILILIMSEAYYTYFISWGKNPNILGAFAQNYVDIGRELNALPQSMPKFVIVKAGGVDVRGLPMPTQTTMFITDTFTPEKQKEKNIFYILPDQEKNIPANSHTDVIE